MKEGITQAYTKKQEIKNKIKTECVLFMNTGMHKKDKPTETNNLVRNGSTQKTDNEEDMEKSYEVRRYKCAYTVTGRN